MATRSRHKRATKITIYALVQYPDVPRYVGSTSNFRRRQYQHLQNLRTGQHSNHLLQDAYDAGARFTFRVLDRITPRSMLGRTAVERYWAAKFPTVFRATRRRNRAVSTPSTNHESR